MGIGIDPLKPITYNYYGRRSNDALLLKANFKKVIHDMRIRFNRLADNKKGRANMVTYVMDGFTFSLYYSSQDVETNNNQLKSNANYRSSKPASVEIEGTWQAVEFRDTLEKVFLLKYDDAASRLKAAEALEDVVPVPAKFKEIKLHSNTLQHVKIHRCVWWCYWQKQFSTKKMWLIHIVGLAKTTYGNLKYHARLDWDEQTSTVKSVLKMAL